VEAAKDIDEEPSFVDDETEEEEAQLPEDEEADTESVDDTELTPEDVVEEDKDDDLAEGEVVTVDTDVIADATVEEAGAEAPDDETGVMAGEPANTNATAIPNEVDAEVGANDDVNSGAVLTAPMQDPPHGDDEPADNCLSSEIGGEATLIHERKDEFQSHDATDVSSMNMATRSSIITSDGSEREAKPELVDSQRQSKQGRFSDQPKSDTKNEEINNKFSFLRKKVTVLSRSKSRRKLTRSRSIHNHTELSLAQQEEGRKRRNEVESSLQRRATERTGKLAAAHSGMHNEKRQSLKDKKITLEQAGLLYDRLLKHKVRNEERRAEMRKEREAKS